MTKPKRTTAATAADAGAELLHAVADATPKMPDARGHNADQLLAIVMRVERVEEEIKAANDGKKEIFAEARSSGFDVPALKKVIAERRMDPGKFMERKAIEDLYRQRIADAEAAQ